VTGQTDQGPVRATADQRLRPFRASSIEEQCICQVLRDKLKLSLAHQHHGEIRPDLPSCCRQYSVDSHNHGVHSLAKTPQQAAVRKHQSFLALQPWQWWSMASLGDTPMRNVSYDPYSALNQKLIDALVSGISFYLAYQLRFDWQVPPASEYQMWVFLLPVMLGRVSVNVLLRTYRMVWRYIDLSDAIVLTRNFAVCSLILLAIRYGAHPSLEIAQIPLSVVALEGLLSLVGSLTARAARRLIYEGLTNDTRGIPVLLVGAGNAGVMVAKELKSCNNIHAVGFLDDDPKKSNTVICGLRVLGPLKAISPIIQQHGAQQVIICLQRPPREVLRRIWAVCEQLGVRVRIVPTLETILQAKTNIAAFRDVEMKDLLGRQLIQLSVEDTRVTDIYLNRSILVTGAGGSIGSELAYQLAKLRPKQLILLDKDENGLHDTYLRLHKNGNGLAPPVVADLRFAQRIKSVFSTYHPDIIFHAAAHKHVHLMEINPCEAIANNVVGTRHLVEQAVAYGVSRFIQVSTDKAVNPTSIMGASKRLCEMIVQSRQYQSGTQFCCVRFGNVLGSRGSVVPIFQEQILQGGPVTVTHPRAQRFLMTIPEAVCLLIQAGTMANGGNIFVLDMGEPVVIEHLARTLIEQSGLRPGKDISIEITELQPGEKLTEVLVDDTTETWYPTPFSKIGMIQSEPFDVDDFNRKLVELEGASSLGSTEDVYDLLRDLNIGFRSQNGESRLAEPMARAAYSVGP
jgi:FlaA1/EpsC-like NDP-sugar epimerase